jgi:hypothetical protein
VSPGLGRYVVQPDHLRGARVDRVTVDSSGDVWLTLDRPHPLGGHVAVGADYVVLSPVPPAALGYESAPVLA